MLRVAIATMGVLVREEQALPKAAEFLQRLIETDFLVLMNNSMFMSRGLAARWRDRACTCRRRLSGRRRWPRLRSWTTSCRAGVCGRRGGSEDRAA